MTTEEHTDCIDSFSSSNSLLYNPCKKNSITNLCTFNVVHQNIQGFSSKYLEISLFLESNNIHLLCITEHWLKKEMLFNCDNYKIVSSFNRESALRGGSLIIIKNNFKCKERKDIVQLSIEQTIEISCAELERFIVICIYRPPLADFMLFESVMEDALSKAVKNSKIIIVCGDFNINLLEESSTSNRLLSLFKSFNLQNLFLEPTRITASSATCIDNIFCDCDPVDKNIINCLTSDHCGQFVKFNVKEDNALTEITYRSITNRKLNQFRSKVRTHALYSMSCTSDDPDSLYSVLFNSIRVEFEKLFPTKKIFKSNGKKFNDWATIGIHRSRTKLYELYNERTYNHAPEFIEYVKKYSKTFKSVCYAAKQKFLSEKIKNSNDKIKTVWKVINDETGKTKQHSNNYKLKLDNRLITSDLDVAAEFEKFFSNIPVETTKYLKSSSIMAETILKSNVNKCNRNFNFHHITSQQIIKNFRSLNVKKTEDLWGISVKVASTIIDSVAPRLALIFNKCIEMGTFPDLMKQSKIIPLFKNGSKSDPSNFRPISILPTFSKIFEKIMLNQLLSHFRDNNLMHNKQYGFTRGRSTADAGSTLVKCIFDAWEKCQDAIGIFCDLSKAFDCVHHETLILKLKYYGISNIASTLIASYLSNRIQKVDINGEKSQGSPVLMGVPQGSILGPFLFLVYINDLPHMVNNLHDIVLFADDTSLVFNIDRNQTNFDDVNEAVSRVLNWFTINNLMLNTKKTKCIRFSLPGVKQCPTKINLNGETLDLVDSAVFLGITVDSKLQWGPHISALSSRLSSAAFAVKKIRQITNVETARLVYFSYFHSIMAYGILLWGSAAELESIFVIQKRAVRAIYNLGSRVSLRERFKKFKILTVISQYILQNIVYIHKNKESFRKNCDVHRFNTRNKNKLALPSFRLHKTTNSFLGLAVPIYNKLPDKAIGMSLNKLKKYVKHTLINKAYYKLNDYLNDKNPWQ